jgi:hypothetical protein
MAAPALAQTAPGAPPSPPRPNAFEQIDTNRDGIITREEATAARAAMFDRLDTNRDGSLTREEMRSGRGLQERRMPPRPHGRRPEGGGNADANGDGIVTRAEWDARTAAAGQAAAQRAAEAFARLDTNRDGQLTAAELAAGRSGREERRMERRGGPGSPRPDRDPARSIDTNNDGSISRAEWMAVPDSMHQRADANNDGQVTRAEAEAAWRRGVRPPAGQR